jgi:hypothetical protein
LQAREALKKKQRRNVDVQPKEQYEAKLRQYLPLRNLHLHLREKRVPLRGEQLPMRLPETRCRKVAESAWPAGFRQARRSQEEIGFSRCGPYDFE